MRFRHIFDQQIGSWEGEAYHGTASDITEFKIDHGIRPVNFKSADVGSVVFFTDEEEAAFGAAKLAARVKLFRENKPEFDRIRQAGEEFPDGIIYKVQIKLKHAYHAYSTFTVEGKAESIAVAKKKKCDGVVFHNALEIGHPSYRRIPCVTIGVFEPKTSVKILGKL